MDKEKMFKLFDIGRDAIEQHGIKSLLVRTDDVCADVWSGCCGLSAWAWIKGGEMGSTYDWNGKEWIEWPL